VVGHRSIDLWPKYLAQLAMRVSIPLYAQRHAAILDHDAPVHEAYGTRRFASELQVTRGLVLIIVPVTMVYRIQSFYLFARRSHDTSPSFLSHSITNSAYLSLSASVVAIEYWTR